MTLQQEEHATGDRLFVFKAMDSDQAVIEGLVSAANRKAAVQRVRNEVGRVITVEEIEDENNSRVPEISGRGVTQEQLCLYTRQLGLLLRSGVHLPRALRLVGEGDSMPLNLVFMWLANDVESGSSMSEAIAKHPKIFNPLYLALIMAAETAGLLDVNLARQADLLEHAVRLKRRVVSAFAYPAVITCVALIVLGLFVWFILPTIRPQYDDIGVELPWLTRFVLSTTDLTVNPLVVGPFALAVAFGWRRLRRYAGTMEGRVRIENRIRRIPVFGPTMDKQEVTAVLYVLATLLDAGIPVTQCIRAATRASSSVRMAHGLEKVEQGILDGFPLTDAFARADIFPAAVLQMLHVGEESGTTGKMMRCAIQLYEVEIEQNLSGMATILEPLVMLVVGGLVGIITLAAFLPSLSMLDRF